MSDQVEKPWSGAIAWAVSPARVIDRSLVVLSSRTASSTGAKSCTSSTIRCS